jgi:hypothetical protein
MISEPIARSTHTMHLSCAEINTISKQTETSFYLDHITYEFDWVCPKWFACLLYVWHKPCTYLASRLTLSPNRTKWASIWPTSHNSSIGCTHKDFRALGTFKANRAPILRWDYHYLLIDQNELPLDSGHVGVSSDVSKMIFEPMVRSAQTVHVSCVKINIMSKQTETSFHLSQIT